MTTLVADLRAFVAAIRKELRVARRYPTQWMGLIFWPVLLPASYVLMGQAFSGTDPRSIAAFAERSGTVEVAGFVFVGYAMYMWLSTILWGPGTALRTEQMRGSLEAVFLTPTSRMVALFGPPAAALPTLVITFVVMGVAMWLLFGVALPLDGVLRSLVVVVFALPSLYAIGSLFAAGVLRFGEIGPIVQLVRGVLVLTCGITFPVLMLPAWAQAVAAVLPPTYIVQDIRGVLLRGLGLGDIALDLLVTAGLSAVLAAFAIVTFRLVERSARRNGMLGRY
ncbi:MAG: ABC transporter permease [Chloroflexota bacterium]